MTEQEKLEQKVADTKAAKAGSYAAYVAAYADTAAAAYGVYVAAKAAHVQAMDEIEEYIKVKDND